MTEYGHKVGDMLKSTFVGFALSMSKEVGILQVLLEAQHPLTSDEIADEKQLKERYVRELLCSLSTAEIIHVSTNEGGSLVYYFEEEEKLAFKSPLAAFSSYPAMLATIFNPIKACLPKSGPYGNRYSEATHNCIEEFSIYSIDLYVEKTLQYVDGLKEKLENGIEVIEFGCGKGHLLARFAQLFPKSTFVASEVVPYLLDQLKANLGHIPNISYEINDLCSLPNPPTKQYDWIYCADVIHDLPYPTEALKGIRKLVKEPGGMFTMIDLATSGSPIDDRGDLGVAFLYAASTFLCIPESFQREDSQALGACWGKKMAISLATAAGFDVNPIDIEKHVALYICKPLHP